MKKNQIGGARLAFDGAEGNALLPVTASPKVFTWYAVITPDTPGKDQMFLTGRVNAFYFRLNNSRAFASISTQGGQRTVRGQAVFEAGKTYYVALTYDGRVMRIYVNGQLDASRSGLEDLSAGITSAIRTIGYWTSTDRRAFKGVIQDVRAFDRALSAVEVQSLANGAVPAGLVQHYPLSEGTGAEARDMVSGSTGTITGTTWLPAKEIKDITVWDGTRHRRVIGKVMTPNGLRDFYRPLNFKTNFGSQEGMNLQTTSTLYRPEGSASKSILPVASTAGFAVGQTITIDDGAHSEDVRITGVSDRALTVSPPLTRTYRSNAIVARTTARTEDGRAHIGALNGFDVYDSKRVRYIRDHLNGSSANGSSHWVEVQAYTEDGANVARGKPATSPQTTNVTQLSYVTDGVTNTSPYVDVRGKASVIVDLGQVHTLSSLRVWHYYGDGRTYNETKTEVSVDGVTWRTIFDSAVSGTYKETSAGHLIQL